MMATPVSSVIDLSRVGEYIRSRQTSDGGFFFARVPPGTARDTFCALASLKLLGLQPANTNGAAAWVRGMGTREYIGQPSIVYYLMGAARCLGLPRATWAPWAERVESFANDLGGYGAWNKLDVEVTSELESSYFAVKALNAAGVRPAGAHLREFVLRAQNADGGFGRGGLSTLASTFYAVSILRCHSEPTATLSQTREWLRQREANWAVPYIEDLYWLIGSLRELDQPWDYRQAVRFVAACQHPSGGFSRTIYGIANLEYAYMALQILAWTDQS